MGKNCKIEIPIPLFSTKNYNISVADGETMDAIRSFENAFSRAIYGRMRKETGCPPVIAVRLNPAHWGWYVEMKDGSCSIDSVSPNEASDVWEAKCRCIERWQDLQNK